MSAHKRCKDRVKTNLKKRGFEKEYKIWIGRVNRIN